jgi:hypothetical protein
MAYEEKLATPGVEIDPSKESAVMDLKIPRALITY